MADIFISYAREDKERTRHIARTLEAMGYDVFWDAEIPPGHSWADYLEARLQESKVMVVLWSHHSTQSQWVREEARIGREKGMLIPVMVDNVAAPFGFGELQAADLSAWNGQQSEPVWQRFVAAVNTRIGAPAPRAHQPHVHQPGAQQHRAQRPSPGYQAAYEGGYGGQVESLSPWGYFMKCMRHFADGKGRARRAEYWWFSLFSALALFACIMVDAVWNVEAGNHEQPILLFTSVGFLALLAPGFSVGARRLHDVGMSGWLMLAGLIPYLGWLFLLIVALIPSKAGANAYGPNPKGE